MKHVTKKAATLALAALIGTAAVAFRLSDRLIYNGKSTPIETRSIGGNTYVKLADVARALDLTVVNRGGGQFELAKAGGANQVAGLTGKIGDTIFDGSWRFTVLSVQTADSYTMKTDGQPYGADAPYQWVQASQTLRPTAGHTLLILNCKVSNGMPDRHTLWTAPSDERIRTALADNQGSSYPPVAYDFQGGPIQTQNLLPGAQLTFPVIFSVPTDAQIDDLVFTLRTNGMDKKSDVRITIKRP